MVGTKNNRRSQMTERLIQDSLINLLQHQSLDEITVTAVCKAADINRGTFYAHYEDVKDFLLWVAPYLDFRIKPNQVRQDEWRLKLRLGGQ